MAVCKDCGKFDACTLEGKTECHDCGAKPGETHDDGCDMEQCTVCRGQRMLCDCKKHNKKKAAWTGLWPMQADAAKAGVCLNCIHKPNWSK